MGASIVARRLGAVTLSLSLWLTGALAEAQRPNPQVLITAHRESVRALRQAHAAPDAALLGIEYMVGLEERPRGRRAGPWLERAETYLAEAEAGHDPYLTTARGQIALRGYRSVISQRVQGYAIYVPHDYNPSLQYPLLVALHGGSSNSNLFTALTLGARVPWRSYRRHWWTVHEPRLAPQWIVVGPNGFGNSMWRYMGERDVMDVISDVSEHYSVDPDRVVLHGLSNGGLGSFNIGTRHAWRFSAVVPLAGAPGWIHYLGGNPGARGLRILRPLSAWPLLPNAVNTHLHAHHGQNDPGRMRPAYLEELDAHADELGVPFELNWYPTGHDLVGPVHRMGRVFDRERARRRVTSPNRVTLVTGDYRAARQHWVEVTRIEGYPAIVEVRAERDDVGITVNTDGPLRALTLYDVEVDRLTIDSTAIRLEGHRGAVGLVRRGGRWRIGQPALDVKRPGLSGPLGDATMDRLIHVYGTGGEQTAELREAAEQGARGWIANLQGLQQTVVSDAELTPVLTASGHLVLYGSPTSNAVLAAIADRLPIRFEDDGIHVGEAVYPGRHLGTRFIYPSPLAPGRYVIVQGAARAGAVSAGNLLPAFLPDWVIYDARRQPERPGNLATDQSRHVAAGFFGDHWELPVATRSERPR